jgi:hypothetical protein
VILIKLSALAAESFTSIHSNHEFNYVLNIFKESIQLSVAEYEIKHVYFDKRIFHKFAKKAVINVCANRLIERQLIMTKAIENARNLKVNQNKKFVQREDVIRVRNCEKVILDRKDEKDRLKKECEMRIIKQQRKR